VVSVAERAGKVLWWVLGGPLVTGAVLGALGWLVQNPLYGVVIGLAAWAIAQVGFTVWAIRKLVIRGEPLVKNLEVEDDTSEDLPPREDVSEFVLAGSHLKDLPFRITEMTRESLFIRGRTFEDCTLMAQPS
jgi:hypothetical protein